MEKMALKRLTASDLTFFKWHFENHNAGNQKAFNLSRNVFVDELYPSLIQILEERSDFRLPVTLYLYGPGNNSKAYILQRKILKTSSYKNWRLNGEFIYPPEGDPERFNILKPNDFALIGFEGSSYPTAMHIDFISSNNPNDKELFNAFNLYMGIVRGNMKKITTDQLNQIVNAVNLSNEHPIYRYDLNEDVLEAVQGDTAARIRVYRHSGRSMSQDELKKAQQKVEDIGRMGEDLIATFLQNKVNVGEISGFEWISRENAVAPYDFKLINMNGTILYIDVKSTLGRFSTPLHISMAEVLTMDLPDHDYLVYRVYELTQDGGKLRISNKMGSYAHNIVGLLERFPQGTRVDSISVSPDTLEFGREMNLLFPDEDE